MNCRGSNRRYPHLDHAICAIAGDHVARARLRAADDVVVRRGHGHAVAVVGQGDAVGVEADDVAEHAVVVGGAGANKADDADAAAAIGRNEIARAGGGSTDSVKGCVDENDAEVVVAQIADAGG